MPYSGNGLPSSSSFLNDEPSENVSVGGTIPVAGISPPFVTFSTSEVLSMARANAFLTFGSLVGFLS